VGTAGVLCQTLRLCVRFRDPVNFGIPKESHGPTDWPVGCSRAAAFNGSRFCRHSITSSRDYPKTERRIHAGRADIRWRRRPLTCSPAPADVEGGTGLIIRLNSPGGDAYEGMRLGRLLRQRRAMAWVGDYAMDDFSENCASACVLALAGAVKRFVRAPTSVGDNHIARVLPAHGTASNASVCPQAVLGENACRSARVGLESDEQGHPCLFPGDECSREPRGSDDEHAARASGTTWT